jgi:hypothetical protein
MWIAHSRKGVFRRVSRLLRGFRGLVAAGQLLRVLGSLPAERSPPVVGFGSATWFAALAWWRASEPAGGRWRGARGSSLLRFLPLGSNVLRVLLANSLYEPQPFGKRAWLVSSSWETRPAEERHSRVHPPARGRGPHGRGDPRALSRSPRRQPAPQGKRDALHAAVFARHDTMAQSGDRGSAQARHPRLASASLPSWALRFELGVGSGGVDGVAGHPEP